jgi:dephospho-CoA kinase
MTRQLTPEEKAKRADLIIQNDGSLEDLKQAVIKVYHTIIHEKI